MRHVWRIIVILCLINAPSVLYADDTHYQDFVVGGRALSLGGAFTGLADDPSGIYYNPAGIVDVAQTSLQVTTSLYGFERGSIDDHLNIPVPGVDSLNVQFTDLIIIPASAGFIKTVGEKRSDGQYSHAYGLSVVVPSFRSFTASTGSLGEGSEVYKRRVTDRELWSGVGYAYRLNSQLSVGLSSYYILRSVVDLEDVTIQEDLPGQNEDKFRSVVNDISFVNGSVVAIAGLKYRVNKILTFGASLQSPSIQMHSEASLRFSRASSDPLNTQGPRSSFEQLINDDVTSKVRYAPCLRVGASYAKRYRYQLSLDVNYHAPVRYALLDVPEAYDSLLPFDPKIRRRGVANINAGGEYLIIREVSFAVGIFSNYSSAPPIPRFPQHDQPPRVNMLGLTMTMGYFGKHSLSRLGFVYSFGKGRDVIPESDIGRVLNQEQKFRKVIYSQSFFYLFLSSTFRY